MWYECWDFDLLWMVAVFFFIIFCWDWSIGQLMSHFTLIFMIVYKGQYPLDGGHNKTVSLKFICTKTI